MGWVLADQHAALKVFEDSDFEIDNPEYMVDTLEAYMGSLTDETTKEENKPIVLWIYGPQH